MKKILTIVTIIISLILFVNFNIVNAIEENKETEELQETEKEQEIEEVKPVVADGIYEFYAGISGTKVIDIQNESTNSRANAQIYERSNKNNQKFKIEFNLDGTYTITAMHSNKVLDVAGGGISNGTNVWQYESNNSDAQKWYIQPCGDGVYNIVSKLNGLYLDISAGIITDRQNIQVYQGNGTNAQKFRLITAEKLQGKKTIEDGNYMIKSHVAEDRVLEVPNLSTNNSEVIKTSTINKKANQKFKITYNDDGTYSINALHSGLALDVRCADGRNGALVQQYNSNKSDAQKWIIRKNDDDTYSIYSQVNGLALDVYGASKNVGANIQTYLYNGTNAQKYSFIEEEPEVGVQSIEDGTYRILSTIRNNMIFDIDAGSTENGAKLQVWSSAKVAQQKFETQYDGEGYYKIKSKKSNKVLTVESEAPTIGSNITQQEDDNLDTQKWIIKKQEEGIYSLISKCGGLYIELPNNNANDGQKLQLNNENDLSKQQFIFVNETPAKGIEQISEGVYKIQAQSGYFLDVSAGGQNNLANVQIWSNSNVQQQKFHIKRVENTNYYTISAVHSAKLLDVYSGNDTPSTNVDQYRANGTDSQSWLMKKTDDGYYNIISKGNGLCLDIYGGYSRNGTNVQLYYSNNSNAQKFKFVPVNIIDNNTYEIETKLNTNMVVDISGASTQDGGNAQMWEADNVNQQQFIFESISTDTYKITAKHSGKALTVGPNNNVCQANYNNEQIQQWQIVEAGDCYYNIVSKASGLALDIYDGRANNGQNVQIYTPNGTNAQKFRFVTGLRKYYEEGIYGMSGLAYAGDPNASNLRYYKIGKGPKVLFTAFSIHGFEDSYDHDGAELTYIAEEFRTWLYNNIDASIIRNWTIYILPCLNPDGQIHGWTNNGPGRTTLFSYAPGNQGIDMNRNWSIGYSSVNTSRNYNGTAPFQAYEAELLANFIVNHQGTSNILIDTHGWLNETMGDNELGEYYRNYFGLPKHIGSYGSGYLINWARTLRNGRSVLVELPEVGNHAETVNRGFASKFIGATMQMLREN